MVDKYYLDTCIWRDFYEDRKGIRGRPLGKHAARLFIYLIRHKKILVYSDLIIGELRIDYDNQEISNMLSTLFMSKILEKVEITEEEII